VTRAFTVIVECHGLVTPSLGAKEHRLGLLCVAGLETRLTCLVGGCSRSSSFVHVDRATVDEFGWSRVATRAHTLVVGCQGLEDSWLVTWQPVRVVVVYARPV